MENPHDKDIIKMIHEDLRSSPEAAPECSHPGVEKEMWGVGAAPCTLICTFLERGHMDNTAAAASQHGKSSHPHRKLGKIHSKPTEEDLKPENLGVTPALWGPGGIWAVGENRGDGK